MKNSLSENTINFEYDNITVINEINLLKCKLETKGQVLKSLSKELIQTKKEKDEFKLMAEQLGEKCSLLKKKISKVKQNEFDELNNLDDYNQIVLNQNYKKSQETIKFLNFELNDLKIKLIDSESDLRLLREKLSNQKKKKSNLISDEIEKNRKKEKTTIQSVITQLEKLKTKNKNLEKDIKLLLDEKEELIKTKNSYKTKADRLNKNLNEFMKLDLNDTNHEQINKKLFDIDSLILENNFLKENLKSLEKDYKFNEKMLNKLKNALEKTNSKKNFFELTSLGNKKKDSIENFTNYLNQDILTTKNVQSFITSHDLDNLELNENTLNNLKKLVLTLFESITDKSTALSLMKENNKLLGKRIYDLEKQLQNYQARELNSKIEKYKNLNSSTVEQFQLDLTENNFVDKIEEIDDSSNENSIENSKFFTNNLNTSSIDSFNKKKIDLPSNLQKLFEKELIKLKNDNFSKEN